MNEYSWEELWIMEKMAQKKREHYLDMRNAHLAAKNVGEDKYESVYKETLNNLVAEFENRFNGQLRKRSNNVWQS